MECRLCHKLISSTEDYIRTTEYTNGKKLGELYHHKKCWFELWNKAQSSKLQNTLDRVFPMIMKKLKEENLDEN